MKIAAQHKSETDFDHELVWGAIGLLVLLAARFFPFHLISLRPCLFLTITGLPCPTCGMTRCFIAMSRLDFAAAWRTNPLGAVFFLIIVCYVIYAAIVIIGRLPRIRIKGIGQWALRGLLAVALSMVIANWAYLLSP